MITIQVTGGCILIVTRIRDYDTSYGWLHINSYSDLHYDMSNEKIYYMAGVSENRVKVFGQTIRHNLFPSANAYYAK